MGQFKTGKELAIIAMKKELEFLTRRAVRAKKELDEYTSIGGEVIAVHEEFVAIVNSGLYGQGVIVKLDALKKRRNRCQGVLKKDMIKLLDNEFLTASERDSLSGELSMLEWKVSMRRD